jgi:hypothetical protein
MPLNGWLLCLLIYLIKESGYYSNVCRGRRQKENQDGVIPYIIEQEENSKEYRRNWARLIQKIYEAGESPWHSPHGGSLET